MRQDIERTRDKAPDEAWHRLAEALSEDVLGTPSESLLTEAAEDRGDRRSLATAFDRVVDRSVVAARRRRLLALGAGALSDIGSALSWRPVLASIGVVLIAVVAFDVYIRVSDNAPMQQVASAPVGDTVAAKPARPRMVGRRDPNGSPSAAAGSDGVSLSRDAMAPPRDIAAAAPQSPANASEARPVAPPPMSAMHRSLQEHVASQAAAPAQGQPTPQDSAAVGLLSAGRADPAPPQAAAAATSAAPSSFIWPVQGNIIASFGPLSGRLRNDGVDIGVPEGTAIHAADDGVVVYAGEDAKGYGNLVLVRHDTGYVTAYAYASKLLVSLGDVVRRGDVIAQSGKSSESHQPELHFEIRRGAVPINPMTLLPPPG
jgi:murein DD-endopeptidase MepM/ murein hydrolase activator NlpD